MMAERAINGDEEVLEYLQFEEMNFVGSDFRTVTWETLCANYHYCAHVLVVATILNLQVLCRTSIILLGTTFYVSCLRSQLPVP